MSFQTFLLWILLAALNPENAVENGDFHDWPGYTGQGITVTNTGVGFDYVERFGPLAIDLANIEVTEWTQTESHDMAAATSSVIPAQSASSLTPELRYPRIANLWGTSPASKDYDDWARYDLLIMAGGPAVTLDQRSRMLSWQCWQRF